MTKDVLQNEIIKLRDKLSDVKFQLFDENNSDVKRHLSYSAEEIEGTLKEKIAILNSLQS